MADDLISFGAKLAQHAQCRPNAPAVSCGAETLTYSQLHHLSNRLARGLAKSGVKFGDLVTVGLPNSVGFVVACYGIWKLGATPQPVSFRLPKVELQAIIDLAQAPLVIAEFDHEVDRPVMSLTEIMDLSDDDSDLPDQISPVSKAPTSGGSTGRPKLILAGQRGVSPADMPELPFYQIQPDQAVLLPGPLYHNAPFSLTMGATQVGAHAVLTPRFDAEGTLAEIHARKITWLYLVPTMMNRIWHLPEDIRRGYDISSVQTLWHMAAPCPPWLKEAFIHWFAPGEVMELYGGTEAQAISVIKGSEWLSHRGSVGRVTVGEMKVVDDNGVAVPAGQVGEIYMRRAQGMPETYKYLGADARIINDGWESLGDLGSFDEEGYLYLADRRTDMILVGGSNVYPAEIEAALEEHPAVQSCAVIGLPNEDLGAIIHAIVNVKGHVTDEDLRAHLADRLVSYKRPRSFEFVDEPVRDDAGKVRRTALRDARIRSG
jgi:bile acid-coenzyme A ligase